MQNIGSDVIKIILQMKSEMEYIENGERQLLAIAKDPDVVKILTSSCLVDKTIMLCDDIVGKYFMPHMATIPFSHRHFAMRWIEYVAEWGNSSIETISINIRQVANDYTTTDLLSIISAFHRMPRVETIYLDGWDDVCERESSFVKIKEAFSEFLNNRTNMSVRIYMDRETFLQYKFDELETRDHNINNIITVVDYDWD